MPDQFVYLEKKAGSDNYRNRGVLPVNALGNNTFETFKTKMELSNLKSFLSDTNLGREVKRIKKVSGEVVTTVVEV